MNHVVQCRNLQSFSNDQTDIIFNFHNCPSIFVLSKLMDIIINLHPLDQRQKKEKKILDLEEMNIERVNMLSPLITKACP